MRRIVALAIVSSFLLLPASACARPVHAWKMAACDFYAAHCSDPSFPLLSNIDPHTNRWGVGVQRLVRYEQAHTWNSVDGMLSAATKNLLRPYLAK